MRPDYLDPYRRHLTTCPDRAKGRNYTLCACPIHCYGLINGRPYRRSLQTNDWARAQLRIQRLLRGDAGDALPEPDARSVSAAVKAYLSDCARRNLQPDSIYSRRITLERLAKFCGDLPVRDLNVDRLAAFRDSLKVEPRTETDQARAPKPRTQRKVLEYLRAFGAYCLAHGWTAANHAKLLRPPRIVDIATQPYTRDEVAKLLTACGQIRGMWKSDTPFVRQRARALVLTLVYSGLRVSDIAVLTRAALASDGHLTLRTEKNHVPVKVLLHPDARAALQKLPAPGGNPKYFFWSGNGSAKNCAKSLWRTVSRIGRVADVHAHPHRFRDTFAVELLTHEADIRTVQKLLGHDSIKTTEKHYAHFVPAHQAILDRAAAALDFSIEPARPLLVHPLRNRRRNTK